MLWYGKVLALQSQGTWSNNCHKGLDTTIDVASTLMEYENQILPPDHWDKDAVINRDPHDDTESVKN